MRLPFLAIDRRLRLLWMDTKQQRFEHVGLNPENESIIFLPLVKKIIFVQMEYALIKAIRFALKIDSEIELK